MKKSVLVLMLLSLGFGFGYANVEAPKPPTQASLEMKPSQTPDEIVFTTKEGKKINVGVVKDGVFTINSKLSQKEMISVIEYSITSQIATSQLLKLNEQTISNIAGNINELLKVYRPAQPEPTPAPVAPVETKKEEPKK